MRDFDSLPHVTTLGWSGSGWKATDRVCSFHETGYSPSCLVCLLLAEESKIAAAEKRAKELRALIAAKAAEVAA